MVILPFFMWRSAVDLSDRNSVYFSLIFMVQTTIKSSF